MRFLIVATAVLACAAAAPSGALLASPYSGLISPWGAPIAAPLAAPLAVAPLAVAPLAIAKTIALPAAVATIPPGDIQGAAIDANTAAVDAVRAVNDQASELQGRAINAAEDNAWQSISAVQTAQAQVDGAAAAVAPIAAKSLVAPVAAYAAPAVIPAPLAPIAPLGLAARAIAAPALIAGSQSISTQSLSQTHPSPAIISAPLSYAHAW